MGCPKVLTMPHSGQENVVYCGVCCSLHHLLNLIQQRLEEKDVVPTWLLITHSKKELPLFQSHGELTSSRNSTRLFVYSLPGNS